MAVDAKEQILITGSKSGEVIVWKNSDYESSVDAQTNAAGSSSNNEQRHGHSSETNNHKQQTRWFIFR